MTSLKDGDTIWRFDFNRRVYRKAMPGEKAFRGGPIYRERWYPVKIERETSRSWVTSDYGHKVAKKGEHFGWAFSLREVEDDCFINEHKHKIAEKVRGIKDAGLLRLVAETIGYKHD